MADIKLTALTAATVASDDDLLYVVDDPGGTPASKKITVANFITSIQGTGLGDVAAGNHTHAGVYEPADATILKSAAIGSTVQAYDADLAAVAALASNGLISRTGAGTAAARTLTAGSAKISITNGDGVSGNPTINLGSVASTDLSDTASIVYTSAIGSTVQGYDADLAAVAGLSSNGIITRTGAGTATVRTITGTTNHVTLSNGDGVSGNPTIDLDTRILTQTLTFVIDGGGSAISTGSKGFLEVPFDCTINRATLLADQSGSIVVDIKKSTYSGFPTTSSICASAKPTLSSVQKSQDATLTGWTTTVTAGDVLEFNVDSATTVTRVTVSLRVTK